MRKLLGGIIIFIYLLSANALTHAQSMDIFDIGEQTNLEHCVQSAHNDGYCIDKCFYAYDQISHNKFVLENKLSNKNLSIYPYFCNNKISLEYKRFSVNIDDRGLFRSVNTPYFSHKNLTKIE